MNPYAKEQQAALDAVIDASALCRAVRGAPGSSTTLTKGDRSPVTVADYGAQAVISLRLGAEFPGDAIVGEESAGELRLNGRQPLRRQVTDHVQALWSASEDEVLDAIDRCGDGGGAAGRRWVLDPIDGTKGFLRGDQYAVALALMDQGRVVLGVLGCPNLPVDAATEGRNRRGCVFVAACSQGVVQRSLDDGSERPIEVSPIGEAAQASFCESVESAHSAHGAHAVIAERLGVTVPPVRMDSQCKYGAVARGEASIYLRLPSSATYEEKIWDHAAGWIVVAEAGGRVTDAHGKPIDFAQGRTLSQNRGIVATNGHLHDQVLRAVAFGLESE